MKGLNNRRLAVRKQSQVTGIMSEYEDGHTGRGRFNIKERDKKDGSD